MYFFCFNPTFLTIVLSWALLAIIGTTKQSIWLTLSIDALVILYKELYYDTTAHFNGQNFGNHNKNLCELKPIDWKWREKIHLSKMANCYAMSYPIMWYIFHFWIAKNSLCCRSLRKNLWISFDQMSQTFHKFIFYLNQLGI